MTNLYKKLIDKIDELLEGEIKKLKPGCRILFTKQFAERNGAVWGRIIQGEPGVYTNIFVDVGFGDFLEIKSDDIAEITGRPITLEDIMRAINTCISFNPYVFTDGECCCAYKALFKWTMGKPLSEQSDKTKEAILNILNQ